MQVRGCAMLLCVCVRCVYVCVRACLFVCLNTVCRRWNEKHTGADALWRFRIYQVWDWHNPDGTTDAGGETELLEHECYAKNVEEARERDHMQLPQAPAEVPNPETPAPAAQEDAAAARAAAVQAELQDGPREAKAEAEAQTRDEPPR